MVTKIPSIIDDIPPSTYIPRRYEASKRITEPPEGNNATKSNDTDHIIQLLELVFNEPVSGNDLFRQCFTIDTKRSPLNSPTVYLMSGTGCETAWDALGQPNDLELIQRNDLGLVLSYFRLTSHMSMRHYYEASRSDRCVELICFHLNQRLNLVSETEDIAITALTQRQLDFLETIFMEKFKALVE